ncbi:hypothetical protein B0H16DRAFT_1368814, partial [Mycena metata]
MKSKVQDIHTAIIPSDVSTVRVQDRINNCPAPSRIFHGRQNILDKMDRYFTQESEKQHIYVLHGLGGAGKTQIALKFIHRSSCFTNIFFLDASTVETIDTGLKNVATLRNVGNSSDDALKWLVGKHEEWLLFFDNADDRRLNLNNFLPQCDHGNIIITTRNPELHIYGSNSQVSDMEEEDAIMLLLKSAAQEKLPGNEQNAAGIVKALCYLPLAIVQAGAFIAKTGTFDSYLTLYARNRDRLLREKPAQTHDQYAWTVYTTWQMSFDQLSPSAAMFLQLCSFLHREGISEDIFSRAACYGFPSFGPSDKELEGPVKFLSQFLDRHGEWDTLSFLEITSEIKAYSLITVTNLDLERRVFSIHPLVHNWSQTTLTSPETYYGVISSIVGMSITQMQATDAQLASMQLLPHVDSVMQFKQYVVPEFDLQYAIVYYHAGRYEEAHKLENRVLETRREVLGDDHLSTLDAMNNLAGTYNKLGQFHEAEALEIMVLEKRKEILGEDHLATLDAMYNLAITCSQLGQFQKAKELEVVVVEKRREILGNLHPDTLAAQGNLGTTYRQLGEFRRARELDGLVIERRKTILGDDHPDTLHAMYNLAMTFRNLGQFQSAEELEVAVVEKRRAILGDDHLETILAVKNLAWTYRELGQFQKVEGLEALVLKNLRSVLGDDHPDTLSALHNLGCTYYQLSKLEEAKELQIEAIRNRTTILGEEDPETLDTMFNLAITYQALGQFQKAEELELVVVEKRKEVLGEEHPDTLSAMGNLGCTYYSLGLFDQAEQLLLEVVEKRITHLGEDHPDTLRSIGNLAETYRSLERVTDAEALERLIDEQETTGNTQ